MDSNLSAPTSSMLGHSICSFPENNAIKFQNQAVVNPSEYANKTLWTKNFVPVDWLHPSKRPPNVPVGEGHIVEVTDPKDAEQAYLEGVGIGVLPGGEWVHGANIDPKTRNNLEQGTATVFLATGEVLSNIKGRLGTASELSLCFAMFKQVMEAQHPKVEENEHQNKETRNLQGCGAVIDVVRQTIHGKHDVDNSKMLLLLFLTTKANKCVQFELQLFQLIRDLSSEGKKLKIEFKAVLVGAQIDRINHHAEIAKSEHGIGPEQLDSKVGHTKDKSAGTKRRVEEDNPTIQAAGGILPREADPATTGKKQKKEEVALDGHTNVNQQEVTNNVSVGKKRRKENPTPDGHTDIDQEQTADISYAKRRKMETPLFQDSAKQKQKAA